MRSADRRCGRFGRFVLGSLFVVILSSAGPCGFAMAQALGGAILLKNDRVIEGKIEPSGDFYSVQLAEQARVSIPKSQVLQIGENKKALYLFKKSSIKRWQPGDHFQLTRWCMVNGLLAEAAEHYQQVASEAGEHPRVKQLALELQSKLLEVPEFRQFLGLEARPPVASPFSQMIEPKSVAAQAHNTSPVLPASNTSLVAAAMHPPIAAHFSRRIQPILLNRCGQTACHGAQSENSLRVIEPYRNAYERVSSENLQSTLSQVSMKREEMSPLLYYATTAHGLQRQPGISVTETQLLNELVSWIQFVQNPVAAAVAERPLGAVPGMAWPAAQAGTATRGIPKPAGDALVPVPPGESGLRPVPKTGLPANPEDFPSGDVPLESEIEALDRQLRQILGEPQPAASMLPDRQSQTPASLNLQSRDPFDPAVFNREATGVVGGLGQ
jgi:hypothetical protein